MGLYDPTFKKLDKMSEAEKRIQLRFGLSDVIYPAHNFSKKSIAGCMHTGEIKKMREKLEAEQKIETLMWLSKKAS